MSKTAEVITEESIYCLTTNQNTITNAQKIFHAGGFVTLYQTENKDLILGECKRSGKSGYHTSADFSKDAPVF